MAVKVTKREEKPPLEVAEIDLDDSPSEVEVKLSAEKYEEGFQTISTERTMPEFPARIIRANKSDLFFDWVNLLEPEDWNHLALYLYREWPWIDRKKNDPNNPNYIDVIGNRVDLDKIKDNHGSGEYKIIASDANVKGKSKGLGEAHFKINDADFPPKIRLDELVVEHRSNKTYVDQLVAEGKLTLEGKVMTPNSGGGNNDALIGLLREVINQKGAQPPKDTTADNIGQMYVKASDSMMSMLKDQIKSDDPEKLIKMLAMFKEMMPKPEQSNSALELLVKMQADMARVQAESQAARESLMLKMMEMMNSKKEEGDTFDKEIDRFLKLKEVLGGDHKEGKKSTLETVLEYGSPILLKLADFGLNIVNMKNYEAGLKAQQAAGGGAQQPQPRSVVIEAPQAPQSTEREGKVVEMPPSPEKQAQDVIRGPAGPMILAALQRGQDGASFAEGIENTFGPLVYDQAFSLGKEGILKAMKDVPEFLQALNQIGATEISVEKFVEEFIEYGKSEEGEEK